ncbi:P-loop containing nucleoside triphosphate hydrolase protein [Macrolepiota fuliginosa MF-IS2]|uniref:ATP-dependent DNA helicase n=1 Tax=Macrolepiota fuliginosa MF-IS2 TaxID=1400762 RepID=A0A9P5XI06_9AGAR|nr:P-loop containing nucleoside triphosphate hydrolase protein [Macrolepiota fuliginosa MF-IS2]
MSSDGYFDGDDQFDDAAFAQLDAIEAAYATTNKSEGSSITRSNAPIAVSTPGPAPTSKAQPKRSIRKQESFYDLTLDLDDEELEKLDTFIADSYAGKARPVIGPTRQTTLFGDVLPNNPSTSKPSSRQGMQRTTSSSRNVFGSKPKKTKVWDQTAFAKTGQKRKGRLFDDEEEEEEKVEFEQFPTPFVPPGELCTMSPPPMKLKPDLLEAKHWLYPLNKPKRDYQYNIVKNSLFENTIISVPTGLGKTFIAGVIMLNYYRWFPEGKVVFVAPTKPLVAQQIEASHQSCGIPGNDAAEMTGEIPKSKREKLWQEKRVFYMTPQTLMNDLATQNCDIMDIILLVIDEAHKATGGYAYNQIVRHMMAKNPHFRLIALTATPGRTPMAVQDLVDGLHISNIEIRDENSIDLRPYIHEKKVEQHCIKMTAEIAHVRDLLAQLMETFLKPLQARGIMYQEQSAIKLHPYAARGRMQELTPDQRGFIGHLSMLGNLAQVMGYLLEGTIGMAFSYLKEASQKDMEEGARQNQGAQSKKLRENVLFKKTMAAFEACKETPTGPFLPHPKMDKAVDILVKYYGEKLPDSDQEEGGEDSGESKAMVFVSHREAVDEIVEALDRHRPMIRASRFIGQGIDKHGKKGQAQKEQLETIQKFQSGEFNVLVATCIGEEGLDIGEVDLILCYDSQKTPIRMLQRFGRTGRKRAGCVHLLLAEGREEFNLEKARASYKEVQKSICRGDDLEFYSDVKRLLPDHIKPTCLEKEMEIKPYVREGRTRAKKSPTKSSATTKRKRNDNMTRNIPAGASIGFVSVADLLVKGSKRKVVDPADLEADGEDDDVDKVLDAGVDGLLSGRRTQSLIPASSKSNPWDEENVGKAKGKVKRAATIATSEATTKPKRKPKQKKAKEDNRERDKDKDNPKSKQKEPTPSLTQQARDDSTQQSPPKEDIVVDLLDQDTERHRSETPCQFTQVGSRLQNKNADDSMAWLVDDDEDPDIMILSSSPALPKNTTCDESIEFVGFGSSQCNILKSLCSVPSSYILQVLTGTAHSPNLRLSPMTLSSEPDIYMAKSPSASPDSKAKRAMPPPSRIPDPTRLQPSPRTPIDPTQQVRRIGGHVVKRPLPQDDPSSDTEEMPPPSQRRLRRYQDTPPPEPKKRKTRENKAKPLTKRKHNALFDYAAEHSGDEVSAGSSDSDDDVESESDRLFIKDSPMTQVSPSYDQTLAYRRSLMTQVPANGPAFGHGPVRNKPFGRMEPRVRRNVVDSSPPPGDDEYEFGSFVVDNDAELSYDTN